MQCWFLTSCQFIHSYLNQICSFIQINKCCDDVFILIIISDWMDIVVPADRSTSQCAEPGDWTTAGHQGLGGTGSTPVSPNNPALVMFFPLSPIIPTNNNPSQKNNNSMKTVPVSTKAHYFKKCLFEIFATVVDFFFFFNFTLILKSVPCWN